MLTIPPAVCDILGRAVHISSMKTVFSQCGLTGCRERMEGLLKQTLMGCSISTHACLTQANWIFSYKGKKHVLGALNQPRATLRRQFPNNTLSQVLILLAAILNSIHLMSGMIITLAISRVKCTKSKNKVSWLQSNIRS